MKKNLCYLKKSSLSLQEIFIVLCLSAVLMVQAYPSENIESQDLQAAGQVELEPSNADDSDLEGAESRYGGGWSRRSGGWGGRGHGKIVDKFSNFSFYNSSNFFFFQEATGVAGIVAMEVTAIMDMEVRYQTDN